MLIKNIKIPKQIILLTSLVVFLVIARIFVFGSYSLIYILWNIFLAFIPFIISSLLLNRVKEKKFKKIFFIIAGIVWLLFLPNAPYLVTDLIHVGVVYRVPALYDSFLLFTSAWIGMLLFMHSLFHMEQILRIKYLKYKVAMIISGIIILTSVGIYLGRFLRFNSWDVFFNHTSISKSIWSVMSQSAGQIEAYLYITLFSVFLYVSYLSWKSTQKL